MNLSEIDYNNIDEDELYRMIFKECNINDFFINQSTVSYEELKNMLAYTMLDNGIGKIMSPDDANKVINSIKEKWIIDENSIFAEVPVGNNNQGSNLYAQNVQKYSARQLQKIDDKTLKNSELSYLIESDFSNEAQNLGYEDMPIILSNGNRIEEYVEEREYAVSQNGGEDIRLSKNVKTKISTLDRNSFSNLENNISPQTLKTIINLPDKYFTDIEKQDFTNTKNVQDLEPKEIPTIERRQYTEEEFSRMAENVTNTVDIGNREQVINQTLKELGLSERLLNLPSKEIIYKMVEKSIQNNGEIKDLTTKDQIELLLKQLNKDLVIQENYIAGHLMASKNVMNQTAEKFGPAIDREDVMEIYINDEDGLYYVNDILSAYIGSEEKNIKTNLYEHVYMIDNEQVEKVSDTAKAASSRGSLEEYNQSKLKDMSIETAIAIKNRPNSEWSFITTNLLRPDIIIQSMKEAGKLRVKENQLQSSTIISGNSEKIEHGGRFNNSGNEITEEDLKAAEITVANRSNSTKAGAVSKIAENSEQTLQYVNEYIEGDAESQTAKAANEEERSHQQRSEQEENITK